MPPFFELEDIDMSVNHRLPPPELINPVGSFEKYALYEKEEDVILRKMLETTVMKGRLLETYLKFFTETKKIPIENLMLVEERRADGRMCFYLEEKGERLSGASDSIGKGGE